MKIDDLEKMESEDISSLSSAERRNFLKLGFAVTGMYLGGSVLSLTSVKSGHASGGVVPEPGKYPYSPHYTMVLREKLCIDCERCKDACVKTNNVPSYGFRTTILEKRRSLGGIILRRFLCLCFVTTVTDLHVCVFVLLPRPGKMRRPGLLL